MLLEDELGYFNIGAIQKGQTIWYLARFRQSRYDGLRLPFVGEAEILGASQGHSFRPGEIKRVGGVRIHDSLPDCLPESQRSYLESFRTNLESCYQILDELCFE